MQFKSTALLMAMAMATLTTASPISTKRTTDTATDSWPVSGFSVGCSPAACAYKFSVTRAAGTTNPGFNTTCEGSDYTSDWQACADSSISAKIVPKTYPFWEVDVMHTYVTVNQEGWAQALANATVEDTVSKFIVTVYQVEGVE
ncbi:hypothetical protein TCE0_039r13193 [Talaromyces pinophilus]|jgi:hypothetical protein|uniref:Uncharacterized protein n=1 Tax=Talaromyces pinophilus TaxID=128442 RepID=A0A6N4SLS0_TALPI|nr:Hypothetical protein PENO1_011350 [Penicillium occitanis (nom. inval.)]PCH09452.1 hypothetical protein PENOC_010180 [Penicillium occitanis (nom. inval.)]GAM40668.1 hypothetical protein TCE0_039r13193 [Talaromyces pinophilus]